MPPSAVDRQVVNQAAAQGAVQTEVSGVKRIISIISACALPSLCAIGLAAGDPPASPDQSNNQNSRPNPLVKKNDILQPRQNLGFVRLPNKSSPQSDPIVCYLDATYPKPQPITLDGLKTLPETTIKLKELKKLIESNDISLETMLIICQIFGRGCYVCPDQIKNFPKETLENFDTAVMEVLDQICEKVSAARRDPKANRLTIEMCANLQGYARNLLSGYSVYYKHYPESFERALNVYFKHNNDFLIYFNKPRWGEQFAMVAAPNLVGYNALRGTGGGFIVALKEKLTYILARQDCFYLEEDFVELNCVVDALLAYGFAHDESGKITKTNPRQADQFLDDAFDLIINKFANAFVEKKLSGEARSQICKLIAKIYLSREELKNINELEQALSIDPLEMLTDRDGRKKKIAETSPLGAKIIAAHRFLLVEARDFYSFNKEFDSQIKNRNLNLHEKALRFHRVLLFHLMIAREFARSERGIGVALRQAYVFDQEVCKPNFRRDKIFDPRNLGELVAARLSFQMETTAEELDTVRQYKKLIFTGYTLSEEKGKDVVKHKLKGFFEEYLQRLSNEYNVKVTTRLIDPNKSPKEKWLNSMEGRAREEFVNAFIDLYETRIYMKFFNPRLGISELTQVVVKDPSEALRILGFSSDEINKGRERRESRQSINNMITRYLTTLENTFLK
ncbi:MAG TPA: hypothetical protein PKD37_01195 [Oligoflexia bacterium]|nr:hypothetical protein [Oligoflexia bacterium]HMP26591.1 hypothetical protein [Oligoflexia bacterium]